MNRLIKSLILGGVLAAGGIALAHGNHGGGEMHHGRRGMPLVKVATAHAQELGLSAQTLAAMQAAVDAARPDLERLHAAARQAREAGTGDAAKGEAAHQALRARREALRTQIDGLLTPEQRTKLQELVRARRDHRGGKSEQKGAEQKGA